MKIKKTKTPHAIRGAGGSTYLILFALCAYSLITGWGSKPGRGANIFGPLEDQQLLTSIRSELLDGNAISLNKNMCQLRGKGQQFLG